MRMNTGIEKALKNIVKNVGDARPILQCAHFENGNITATDNHQLIRFRNAAPKELNLNLNLANFTFDDRNFPDTERLIPTKFITTFEISANSLVELLPMLKSLKGGTQPYTEASLKDGHLKLLSTPMGNSGIAQEISIDVENVEGKEEMKIAFNSMYLTYAIQIINELKKFGQVKFQFQSQLRPFLVTYENMDYLITPVRIF